MIAVRLLMLAILAGTLLALVACSLWAAVHVPEWAAARGGGGMLGVAEGLIGVACLLIVVVTLTEVRR